jgi:hypothetical protein
MSKELELAKQHGIKCRRAPYGTTEMWCYDRDLQSFAEALVAAERERCAALVEEKITAGGQNWHVWMMRIAAEIRGPNVEAQGRLKAVPWSAG